MAGGGPLVKWKQRTRRNRKFVADLHACQLILLLVPLAAAAAVAASSSATGRLGLRDAYPAIFVFGDSISDAGNAAIASHTGAFKTIRWPYGETFPGWPAGRYSDGHTLVDWLASYMGLSLPNAYLNSSAGFGDGVSYAVGGATALNMSFLNSLGIYSTTNYSLDVQLSWHAAFKASVEASNGSQSGGPYLTAFEEGLYVIEIGGDDYFHAFLANYTPSFVKFMLIPLVIEKIHSIVETLLDYGAKKFLFISMTPMGCSPGVLLRFDGIKDINGCLEEYNSVTYHHGVQLQGEVSKLRTSYPNATFLFMDYYGAFSNVFKQKETFGFVETFKVCCGAGDDYPYNYNILDECSINSISVCSNPSTYIVWDGNHFTDAFNFQIFNQTFIVGSYLDTRYSLL